MSQTSQKWSIISVLLPIVTAVSLLSPFYCNATAGMGCEGTPYNISIYVGSGENGGDFLSEVVLHKEGYSDRVAFYDHDDLVISTYQWEGESGTNIINISSKPGISPTLEVHANNDSSTIEIDGKKFAVTCFWER